MSAAEYRDLRATTSLTPPGRAVPTPEILERRIAETEGDIADLQRVVGDAALAVAAGEPGADARLEKARRRAAEAAGRFEELTVMLVALRRHEQETADAAAARNARERERALEIEIDAIVCDGRLLVPHAEQLAHDLVAWVARMERLRAMAPECSALHGTTNHALSRMRAALGHPFPGNLLPAGRQDRNAPKPECPAARFRRDAAADLRRAGLVRGQDLPLAAKREAAHDPPDEPGQEAA
jgi:hypothetical protein